MKNCLHCKNDFEPKKPKQIFCSDKCRVYSNRAKKTALKNEYDKVVYLVFKDGTQIPFNKKDVLALLKWFENDESKQIVNKSNLVPKPPIKKEEPLKINGSKDITQRMDGESMMDYKIRLAERQS